MPNRNVSFRAVLLALLITIPNSYWLMINWGTSGYSTGSEFPDCLHRLLQRYLCCAHLDGGQPFAPNNPEKCQPHRCRVDGGLSTRIHRLLHRWTRHTPDTVAPAHLSHLVR